MISIFLFAAVSINIVSYASGSISCIAVPQKELPQGSHAVKTKQCKRCTKGYKYWPCDNINPSLCNCNDDNDSGVLLKDSPSQLSCVAIPQVDLPKGKWATNDNECAKCADGYKWWPCDEKLCDCDSNKNSIPQDIATQAPIPSPSPTKSARPSTVPSASPSGLATIFEAPPTTQCEADFDSKCSSKAVCEANLGVGLSEATGANNLETFPIIQGGNVQGRDDSVAVLVGGNYRVKKGAEIEGKIVVLGDFTIESNANFHSLVRAGAGSQVIPNNGETAIIVGGDLNVQKHSVSFMQQPAGYGNIVYKGQNLGSGPSIISPSSMIQDSSADLGQFEQALCDVKEKSEYWATLPSTGLITEEGGAAIIFSAGSNDCVQVFNVDPHRLFRRYGWIVLFDSSMEGKTALINVAADSDGKASLGNLADFEDPSGKHGWDFSSDTTASILWNFHNATDINLGCGVSGNGELRGSLLVPTPCSNVEFCFPGHSGRVIVNGDLTQNKAGSEFHNYEFDPVCSLPEPPSYGSCS